MTPETEKMVENVGHTPTPWNLEENGWCRETDLVENQPFIVQAVNVHEELLEAVKAAKAMMYESGVSAVCAPYGGAYLVDKLASAITKAEGKGAPHAP